MSLEHPLDHLLQLVDPRGCRLIKLPERIWIFGGPVGEGGPPSSLRDSFWRMALVGQPQHWFRDLDRPENYPEWWAFSGYEDLLEFERDACYLARNVILFSESPGSYAELGALALDDSILPRLFVVVQSRFLGEDLRRSFLNLGPIHRANNSGARCVIEGVSPSNLSEGDYLAIVDCFNEFTNNGQPERVAFNKSNPTHVLLLIADLVDLLLVCKTIDIQKALKHFEVNMTDSNLKKSLNLLDFFKLVRSEHRGREQFWGRIVGGDAPWVDYTSKMQAEAFDRYRFKIMAQQFVESDKALNYIFGRGQ